MKGRYKKKGLLGGILLAALAAVAVLSPAESLAMDRIDMSKKCSFTLVVSEGAEGEYKDLEGATFTVKAYQVAQISENAAFTPLEGFEEIGIPKKDEAIKTSDWTAVAEKAAGVLGVPYGKKTQAGQGEQAGEGSQAGPAVQKDPEYTFRMKNKETTTAFDKKGLFLIVVDPVYTATHEYTFLPYLVTVPNNLYYVAGSTGYQQPGADKWIYDGIEIGLKPEQSARTAQVTIKKILDRYNATLGDASFVFQVDAYRDGECIYSVPVSLNFTEPGELSATVTVPAGTTVVVREVYSNRAYELKRVEGDKGHGEGDSWVLSLIPDPDHPEEDLDATVTFTNDVTDDMGRGTSVVNHFADNGSGWVWEKHTDSRDIENHTQNE